MAREREIDWRNYPGSLKLTIEKVHECASDVHLQLAAYVYIYDMLYDVLAFRNVTAQFSGATDEKNISKTLKWLCILWI